MLSSRKQGAYIKFDKKMKIKIGKYSSKNGISMAARHFSMELGRNINPSTVCGFKRGTESQMKSQER